MKANSIFLSFFFFVSLYSLATTYDRNHFKAVSLTSPPNIIEKSTGVCSLNINRTGLGGCSGFRIGQDLIMTNFHCLPNIHEHGQGNLHAPKSSKLLRQFMSNDLATLNSTPQYFGYVNFNILESRQNESASLDAFKKELSKSALKIEEVTVADKSLDFAIIRVNGLTNEYIFSLSLKNFLPTTKLIMITHSSEAPYPKMKVYDHSSQCSIFNFIGEEQDRKFVFGHKCDSASGSSGSALIHNKNGYVVGLHFGGGAEERLTTSQEHRSTYNRAVQMSAILHFLREHRPDIYAELNVISL